MSTETLSFGLLGPEKNAFKDGNPTLKITKYKMEYFLEANLSGVLTFR